MFFRSSTEIYIILRKSFAMGDFLVNLRFSPLENERLRAKIKSRTKMNTTEHLELILTYCRRCLAIAEKRTLGKWRSRVNGVGSSSVLTEASDGGFHPDASAVTYGPLNAQHAEFIATCAGAAESGWRATIAAISGYKRMETCRPFCEDSMDIDDDALHAIPETINAILAAYPLELIQSESAK